MIAKLSAGVANWLRKSNAISEEDTELYSFAVYSLIFGVAPIAIALGFGLLFGMVPQALLLIAPFMLIRKFSGGYHLDSPVVCFLSSCLLVALSLGLVRWLTVAGVPMWYHVLILLATVSLWTQSPIDSEARRLSQAETRVFRRVARWMAVSFLGIYFLLVVFTNPAVSVPISMGILIAALLQIPCTILKLAKGMQSPAK